MAFVTTPTISVANYFVRKALNGGESLTPMKLVKLVYIAHGWRLGLYGEPLLGEAVEAWKYGPVVPSVYHRFKSYGDGPVTRQAYLWKEGQMVIPEIEDDLELKEFLDRVWDVYRDFSALQLSTMTHQRDTPWDTIWRQRGGSETRGAIIPDQLIQEHYQHLAAAR